MKATHNSSKKYFIASAYGGTTNAYMEFRNGHNRSAKTVLYERPLGNKSYYVVEAVPDTTKKALYIVSAFIGNPGYRKTSQFTDALSPGTTPKSAAVKSNNIILREDEKVNAQNEKHSRELDPTVLAELDRAEKNGDVIRLYRTMQILDIDGQKVMMSPMNARRGKGKDVKWDQPFAIK